MVTFNSIMSFFLTDILSLTSPGKSSDISQDQNLPSWPVLYLFFWFVCRVMHALNSAEPRERMDLGCCNLQATRINLFSKRARLLQTLDPELFHTVKHCCKVHTSCQPGMKVTALFFVSTDHILCFDISI